MNAIDFVLSGLMKKAKKLGELQEMMSFVSAQEALTLYDPEVAVILLAAAAHAAGWKFRFVATMPVDDTYFQELALDVDEGHGVWVRFTVRTETVTGTAVTRVYKSSTDDTPAVAGGEGADLFPES